MTMTDAVDTVRQKLRTQLCEKLRKIELAKSAILDVESNYGGGKYRQALQDLCDEQIKANRAIEALDVV